ncbi:MAG: T9SS type A sorting domain-containing protein [Ignavibacteria bacterium]|nr:T9SS type A sorting domain-containing protein [Ignavibacteria bacterium]
MKKVIFTIVLILLTVTIAFSGDRMMLLEFFTSSTCGPCASNNPILTAFVNSKDPERLAAIAYHMNWPSPGNDPMYLYNPNDNNARRTYYNVNSIPQSFFDGIYGISPPYSQSTFQYYYTMRENLLSPVTILLKDSVLSGDSILIRVTVYGESYLSNPNATLHIAVIENHIHYQYPPGTNGETDFYWVMRRMFPNGNGSPITLFPGTLQTVEYRFKRDTIWNQNQVSYLAFVQAANKEILGAAKRTVNFTLLPYPAYRAVLQGQSGSGTFRVRVPLKATGYNMPLTFSATVSPSNTNVTVNFPNGNTLSNLNDSLLVQVNSTSAAPAGVYQIILTATDANNKSHKTTVSYLINRNYVLVGTNRNGVVQYKVDGNTYTTYTVFDWEVGSSHTLQAISPMNYTSYQYVFQNWSNNGDTTQTITVNTTTNQYIAYYKLQWKLQASTNPSGIFPLVNISNANMYHDSGSVVTVSISPLQVQFNNKTYYFNRWVGGGQGSYNGTNPTFQVTMNNFINQIAIFDTVNIYVKQISSEVPAKYELMQNYPNPFNPSTKIKFAVPKSGVVTIKVFDILGRQVNVVMNNHLEPGYYETEFDGSDLPSGIYFYKLEALDFTEIKSMVLLK